MKFDLPKHEDEEDTAHQRARHIASTMYTAVTKRALHNGACLSCTLNFTALSLYSQWVLRYAYLVGVEVREQTSLPADQLPVMMKQIIQQTVLSDMQDLIENSVKRIEEEIKSNDQTNDITKH